MIDLSAARADLAAALARALPDMQVSECEPEQPRPPAALVVAGDPWLAIDSEQTYAGVPVRWSVRVIMQGGPSVDVARRCDDAASAILDIAGDNIDVTSISAPYTLIVNDSQAFPAFTVDITQWVYHTID